MTVIICTRNNATGLRTTLECLTACHASRETEFEVVVVDNNSTDNTREIVMAAAGGAREVRYIFEPKVGQVHARNAGIAAAAGGIIVFTDDDVAPAPNWVEEICMPIVTGSASVTMGPVTLRLSAKLPEWFDRNAGNTMAAKDLGEEELELSEYELVGANMAFKKSCISAVGGFNTLLGPGRSGFFDDTEFSWRLVEAGFRAVYCPKALVVHTPNSSRITKRSLRREWFRLGLSGYIATEFHPERRGPEEMFLARRLLRVCKLTIIRWSKRGRYQTTLDEMFLWMHLGSFYGGVLGLRRLADKLKESTTQPGCILRRGCELRSEAVCTL